MSRATRHGWDTGMSLHICTDPATPPLTPAEHHARYCESRPIQPQSPLEACPFRPWHDTQEPRTLLREALRPFAAGSRPVTSSLDYDRAAAALEWDDR